MEAKYLVPNIRQALETRLLPTVTVWNRLEGRPRTEKFDRALKAEVRDALWMLSRQWQMGEFRGDDAGTPVLARLHLETTRLTRYQAGDHAPGAFEEDVPLEAKVEQRPLPFRMGQTPIALDLRLQMGRQWLKLLGLLGLGTYTGAFTARYAIAQPDPTARADAQICAHPEVWQSFAAVAGRRMDGAELYFYVKADLSHHAYDGVAAVADGDKPALDDLAARFVAWFERLYYQPAAGDAWQPDRLEYQFAVSAPVQHGDKVLSADEYYHGHLDWYNFEVAPRESLGPTDGADPRGTATQTLIPTPIAFNGMPNTRWWTFEDRRTNFGDIKPDTTDLAKLLLIEFGLVYANDWFMVPYTLPAGSVAQIRGMAVTNTFGERTWVEAAGRGADDAWQRWSMFTLATRGAGGKADTSLLLLPTVPKVQEGAPLEEVMLVRDEMANMVWGIEKTVPLATGAAKPGGEAALETVAFYRRLLDGVPLPPVAEPAAPIRYQVMNSVPEHWIPFIPVHVPGDNREIQLQRAALPRIVEGDPAKPVKVRPRTVLLREGLDRQQPAAYFLHEEEVPRAGVRVTQAFQRTRWRDGRVFVWLGVHKETGRGEGASGLAFDRLVNPKQ